MPNAKILAVDDNEPSLYLLKALLQGHGFSVDTAVNGAEALGLARKAPPDLVVSDILMPVMDGFALCRAWKGDAGLRGIPFVFYTATYTDERDREFALKLGADRFLVKPTEPDRLVQAVLEALASKEPARAGSRDGDGAAYLREYNEALIRKLEDKMEELERGLREKAAAQGALEESEGRFSHLLEAAPEGIFVSAEDRFTYLNPAMARILGAAHAEDLLGAPTLERVAPTHRGAVQARVRAQVEEGRPVPPMEMEYLRLDGSAVPVEAAAVAVRFKGRASHLVFVRDVTERRSAERERARLAAQLSQAQRMEAIGQLVGSVAHDFNNMLSVILGNTEVVLEGLDPASRAHAELQDVQKAAQRSAELTRQLLAFARKQTAAPAVMDLDQAASGLLNVLRRLVGPGIRIEWKAGTASSRVKLDPSQVDQVITNLVVNARDAIGEREGRILIQTGFVTLGAEQCAGRDGAEPGDFVTLCVSDNGCGMDAATLGRLFEPFFTTKGIAGTGLGLATVHGIVRQNRGFIEVSSAPGQGAAFTVHFPHHSGPIQRAGGPGEPGPAAQGCKSILLVEDEAVLLRTTRQMLENLGYDVLAAASPAEAIRLAGAPGRPIDLLLTDVVLPEMNGRDLSEVLLKRCPGMKCLFVSGYPADIIANRGILDETLNFLQKPFTTRELAQKISRTLAS